MTRFRLVLLTILLGFTVGTGTPTGLAFAQNNAGSSNQDKAQACKNAADKRGLSGDDRKNFLQSCLNKAAGNQPTSTQETNAQQTANQKLNDTSQQDKANACKNLADKKNLSGQDRRTFLKDCMNKANPNK